MAPREHDYDDWDDQFTDEDFAEQAGFFFALLIPLLSFFALSIVYLAYGEAISAFTIAIVTWTSSFSQEDVFVIAITLLSIALCVFVAFAESAFGEFCALDGILLPALSDQVDNYELVSALPCSSDKVHEPETVTIRMDELEVLHEAGRCFRYELRDKADKKSLRAKLKLQRLRTKAALSQVEQDETKWKIVRLSLEHDSDSELRSVIADMLAEPGLDRSGFDVESDSDEAESTIGEESDLDEAETAPEEDSDLEEDDTLSTEETAGEESNMDEDDTSDTEETDDEESYLDEVNTTPEQVINLDEADPNV